MSNFINFNLHPSLVFLEVCLCDEVIKQPNDSVVQNKLILFNNLWSIKNQRSKVKIKRWRLDTNWALSAVKSIISYKSI